MVIQQNIIPMRGYILGETLSEERITESGLWIAPTLKKGIPPKRVKVLAIGKPTYHMKSAGQEEERDGKRITRWRIAYKNGKPKEKAWHYKPGDTLYVKPHTGLKAYINGKWCAFYRRGDVIGVQDGK